MNRVQIWYRRGVLGAGALAVAGIASAQSTDVSTLFDSVDLSGVATKVMALAVTIVGIALVIKGPSIVKRLIAKI
jgi:hypothetical protein